MPHIEDISTDTALLREIGSGARRVVPFMHGDYQRSVFNAIGRTGEIFAAPGNLITTVPVENFTPDEINREQLEGRLARQLVVVQRDLELPNDAHIDPNFIGFVDASRKDPMFGAIDLRQGEMVQVSLSQLTASADRIRALARPISS
jgi:hypothetical protein